MQVDVKMQCNKSHKPLLFVSNTSAGEIREINVLQELDIPRASQQILCISFQAIVNIVSSCEMLFAVA